MNDMQIATILEEWMQEALACRDYDRFKLLSIDWAIVTTVRRMAN